MRKAQENASRGSKRSLSDPIILQRLLLAAIMLLGLVLLAEAVFSLQWRLQHDTPLLHYVAFLIDKQAYVPYRDVFETSMPGAILFHLGLVKSFGYEDLAFRLVDVVYLALLLVVTWRLMRFLMGPLESLLSPVLFGLYYFSAGPAMSLQRDYIGILPMAIAVLLVRRAACTNRWRWIGLAVGLLFGLAASVKPHLAIGLPALVTYLFLETRRDRSQPISIRLRRGASVMCTVAVGFGITTVLPFLWLWRKGGLPCFWEMVNSYLPLHLQLGRDHQLMTGLDRWLQLFRWYQDLGGWQSLLLPIGLGLFLAFPMFKEDPRRQRFLYLLLSLLLLYSIYPVLGGKFWDYHWMPFVYFGTLCASLIVLPLTSNQHSFHQRLLLILMFFFLLVISVRPPIDILRQILEGSPPTPGAGRVDEVAGFLKTHLRDGDRVQPLDWTGGAIHGMLNSEAVLATPYLYDYHFYHHVSSPYIQEIRKRFMRRLKRVRPRFIIDFETKPRPWGRDTTREFPALTTFISQEYGVAYQGNGFNVLELRVSPSAPDSRGSEGGMDQGRIGGSQDSAGR